MGSKRKRYDASFKAKVALEAIKGKLWLKKNLRHFCIINLTLANFGFIRL